MTVLSTRRNILSLGSAFAALTGTGCVRAAELPITVDAAMLRRYFLASLRPEQNDPAVSKQFAELAATRPWLNAARNNVGKLYHSFERDGQPTYKQVGSAVIFDDEGTVLLSGHQETYLETMFGKDANIGNHIAFNIDDRDVLIPTFKIDVVAGTQDIALGKISPDVWSVAKTRFKYGPPAIGPTDPFALIGKEVLLVGYPELSDILGEEDPPIPLHASAGIIQAFSDYEVFSDPDHTQKLFQCRQITTAAVLDGFSGGAAYVEGQLIGTTVSGDHIFGPNADPHSSIVPISFSLALYEHFYPERAARRGLMGPVRGAPQSCMVNPDAFPRP